MKDNYLFENFLESQIGKSIGIEKGLCDSNAGILLARINSTLFKVGLSGDFIEVRSDNLFFINHEMRAAYATYTCNVKRCIRNARITFEDTLTKFMVALIEHNNESPMMILDLATVKDRIYRGIKHALPRNYTELVAKMNDALTAIPVVNRLGHWCIVTPDTSEDDYVMLVACGGTRETTLAYGQASLSYLFARSAGSKKISLVRAKIPDEINVTFTAEELELEDD